MSAEKKSPNPEEAPRTPEVPEENSLSQESEARGAEASQELQPAEALADAIAELRATEGIGDLLERLENCTTLYKDAKDDLGAQEKKDVVWVIYYKIKKAYQKTADSLDRGFLYSRMDRLEKLVEPDDSEVWSFVEKAWKKEIGQGLGEEKKAEEPEEKPEEEPEKERGFGPEAYRQDLADAAQDLRDLIEEGRSKLSQEDFNPFENQEGESRSEKSSYYQRLLNQEEFVLTLKEQLVADLDKSNFSATEKTQLNLDLQGIAKEALREAQNYRQQEFVPTYFDFNRTQQLKQLIQQNEDLKSGKLDPESFVPDNFQASLLELVRSEMAKLEEAQQLDLAPEDLALIKDEGLADMRQKLQVLEQAKLYHEQYGDFIDSPAYKKLKESIANARKRKEDIADASLKERSEASLSEITNYQDFLSAGIHDMEERLEPFDQGSAPRKEGGSLLSEAKNALGALAETYSMVEAAQLETFEIEVEEAQLFDTTERISNAIDNLAEDDLEQKAHIKSLRSELKRVYQRVEKEGLLSASRGGYKENQKVEDRIVQIKSEVKTVQEEIEKVFEDEKWTKWLRGICEQMERLDGYVAEKPEFAPNISLSSTLHKIEAEVDNPELAQTLTKELEARAALHDAYLVFATANYEIDPVEQGTGYLNLTPGHFETLFHEISGVKELIPIALSMYEMAMKGGLPGFESENFTPAKWRTYKDEVGLKIGEMLGKNGPLASKLAGRLVEATAMPAYYEDEFGFDKKMPQRDVMFADAGRRTYYGNPERRKKSGVRAHGSYLTVGKYWNFAPDADREEFRRRAYNQVGEYVNPLFEMSPEPGEPGWDLLSDFWMQAPIIDPDTKEVERFDEPMEIDGRTLEYGPIKTLARKNRYAEGEMPDFEDLRLRLVEETGDREILTDEQIAELRRLPWFGDSNPVVKYPEIDLINDQGKPTILTHGYRLWAEQFAQRKVFYDLITNPEGPSPKALVAESWFETKQTITGYLPNSAAVLRDLRGEDKNKKIRAIQFQFLWGALMRYTPGEQPSEQIYVDPELIKESIDTAEREGYVSGSQADWLRERLGVKGILPRADRAYILDRALRRAGLSK